MKKHFKAPQYNTRLEISVHEIRLDGIEGVFSVTYLPPEMCLVGYYIHKTKSPVTMITVAYSLRDGSVTENITESEISEREAVYDHLGQVLLEFSKESGHSVDNFLPNFLVGLARKLREHKEKESSSLDKKLTDERKRHRERIIVPTDIREIVSSKLRQRREKRQREMLNP